MALIGIEAVPCEVEVDVTGRGFGAPTLVGLPDSAVKESVDRIRSALFNSGFVRPKTRTTINLAPADIKKEGPAFDLPIAIGMLLGDDQLRGEQVEEYLIVGELALDGRVRPIKGALSLAMLGKQHGFRALIVPRENAEEAAVVDGVEVYGVSSLTEAVSLLAGELPLEPTSVDLDALFTRAAKYEVDFADVRGQEHVKRAILIAAAGRHNMLMIGPSASSRLSANCDRSYDACGGTGRVGGHRIRSADLSQSRYVQSGSWQHWRGWSAYACWLEEQIRSPSVERKQPAWQNRGEGRLTREGSKAGERSFLGHSSEGYRGQG